MRTHPFVQRSHRLAFPVAFAVVAFAACQRSSPAEQVPSSDGAQSAPAPSAPPLAERRLAMADMSKSAAQSAQPLPGRSADSVAPNMIIRTGAVSIEVDSLELAVAAVRALAVRLGGLVGNVSTSTGEYAVRSATLELKLPSPRFDEAMSGMLPIGKVEQSNTTAEDVGEEFVDVSARVANSRRLETRLIDLLATRTGKLEDVLAVERELARVREEIDRYEGRIRFLRSRVSMSTLTVTLHEKAPLVNPNPGTNVIGQAFRDMWRNFVGLVAAVIASLGVIVPVVALGFVGWRFARRSR